MHPQFSTRRRFPSVPRTCYTCGAMFMATPSSIAKGGGKYCSRACLATAQRGAPLPLRTSTVHACLVCGKSFVAKASKLAVGKGKYCSRECFNTAQCEGPRERQCAFCGSLFEGKPYAVAHRRYCGRVCSGLATRGVPKPWVRGTPPIPIEVRLWPKVDKTIDHWLWGGRLNQDGYGFIDYRGRSVSIHRAAWELVEGPIPEGMTVCHTCDVRNCLRNDEVGVYVVGEETYARRGHLWLGTQAANMADASTKGRLKGRATARGERHGSRLHPERVPRGEQSGAARLTEAQVADIRRRWAAGGIHQADLALVYGVSQATISFIVSRHTWKHVA